MPLRLSRYKSEALKLGFKVIDIYRYKDREVLRGIYRGKVVMIELSRPRNEMDLEAFRKELQNKLS